MLCVVQECSVEVVFDHLFCNNLNAQGISKEFLQHIALTLQGRVTTNRQMVVATLHPPLV